jgi:hypothetical protein
MMQTLSARPLKAQLILQGFMSLSDSSENRGEEVLSCLARKHHTLGVLVKNTGRDSVKIQTQLQVNNNNDEGPSLLFLGPTHSRQEVVSSSPSLFLLFSNAFFDTLPFSVGSWG